MVEVPGNWWSTYLRFLPPLTPYSGLILYLLAGLAGASLIYLRTFARRFGWSPIFASLDLDILAVRQANNFCLLFVRPLFGVFALLGIAS